MPDERHGPAVELPEPGHDRAVVETAPVAVQLDPVLEDLVDVVERVRAIGMSRQLDERPDLLLGGVLPRDGVELLAQPLFLSRDAGAVEQRQALEPAEPLPQPALGLSAQRG